MVRIFPFVTVEAERMGTSEVKACSRGSQPGYGGLTGGLHSGCESRKIGLGMTRVGDSAYRWAVQRGDEVACIASE